MKHFNIILLFSLFLGAQNLYADFNYLPTHSYSSEVVYHKAYALQYDEKYEQADWVAYELTKDMVEGSKYKRSNKFRADPDVKTGSANPSDYTKSGYDRGHLCPAADMSWDSVAMLESFYMSNMSPQVPGFNRGIWKRLEEEVRQWAVANKGIYVVTGPILSENPPTIGKNKVAVPNYYYKVILDYTEPEIKGIGFVLPNKFSSKPLYYYSVTIDFVEALTGIDFFPELPDSVEEKIEGTAEKGKWFDKTN